MINGYSLRWKAALVGLSCVFAMSASPVAFAQEGNTLIGPPQLRDFQLEPRQRIVTQPRPAPAAPAETAPAPAERPATQRLTPAPAPQANRPVAAARAAAPTSAPGATGTTPAPAAARPAISVDTRAAAPAPAATAPTATGTDVAAVPAAPPSEPVVLPDLPAPSAPTGSELPAGPPTWLYFLAFAVLGLLGYGYWLRRRNLERRSLSMPGAAPAAAPAPALAPPPPAEPAAPRPAPQPRPWIDVEITAERATVDVEETVVEFELLVRNTGGSEARNVRLQARMFPSTPEQDKQITAYFKGDGKEFRTIALPPLPPGDEIRVKGSVDMDRDRISALRVDGKLLLIPLVAVIARYEWGNGRFGVSGKSWVIGREGANGGEKMGPFRVDQGARVYRTIGQRPHGVSRRI
jgi:hypothetical protein